MGGQRDSSMLMIGAVEALCFGLLMEVNEALAIVWSLFVLVSLDWGEVGGLDCKSTRRFITLWYRTRFSLYRRYK